MAVAVQEKAYKNNRWPEPLLNLADAFKSSPKGMRLMSLLYYMLHPAARWSADQILASSRDWKLLAAPCLSACACARLKHAAKQI